MTKSILSLLAVAIAGGTFTTSAQDAVITEETVSVTDFSTDCDQKYYNTWRDGWFIQAGAGVGMPVMEGFKYGTKHVGAAYNLGFGRWFSPYFGFRVSGYYGNYAEDVDNGSLHFRSATLNGDVLWDMTNSIGGVDLDRPVSVVSFLGIGGAYTHQFSGATDEINVRDREGRKTTSWTLPVSAGLQVRFRLCRYVDFFLEGRASFAGDNFNNIAEEFPIDITFQGTGGFTFNIGGKSFQTYSPCADQAYMAALNSQINNLRDELAATSAALAVAESQLPCPEPQTVVVAAPVEAQAAPLLTTVRFTINSAKVSSTEMVNVYNIAQYMNENPDSKITITGYADKDTGSTTYNQTLSERRAQAVYDILVNNYGISADRLTKSAAGSTVQPYDTNNWNRIVIFSQD